MADRILPKGNYVNGSFLKPSKVDSYVERVNPGNLADRGARFPVSLSAVDHAVSCARQALPAWRDTPLLDRAAALRRFRENLDAHRDRLADTITRESGKPRWESLAEINLMMAKVDVTLEAGVSDVADFGPGGNAGICRYRPLGVCVVLAPFNFPGHLPASHFIPALATGNTVVYKPSPLTPGVGQVISDLVDRSKFPRGVFNMIQGDADVGRALAIHADVNGVFLHGRWETGLSVQHDTVGQVRKLLALETGGKNAAIVLDAEAIDRTAYEIAFSAFVTAGQRCTATSRVFVTHDVAPKLLPKLIAWAKGVKVGDPFDESVFMGPLASDQAVKRLIRGIDAATAAGAEPLVSGGPAQTGKDGFYVRPSIHRLKVLGTSLYETEELFAPDLAVYEVESVEHALEQCARSEYGLALAVFTSKRDLFDKVRRESRDGIVNWNRGTVGASSRLPLGGTGRSGNYRPTALHAVRYATWPQASMEDDRPSMDGVNIPPGFVQSE
ncbi:MAG TPA: aldehyde dehydrogenase family protein [bacterium]|nr:aldehyde dehydrogenase family protein [bacterium]